MTQPPIRSPYRRTLLRWGAALFVSLAWLAAAGLPAARAQPIVAPDPGPFEIEVGLGAGFVVAGRDSAAVSGIVPGFSAADIVQRILAYRLVHPRVLIDIDYSADRLDETLFGSDNYFSLSYRGPEGAAITGATIGNRVVALEGDRYLRPAATPGATVAASLDAAHRTAAAVLRHRVLVSYGASSRVTLRFEGNRQVVTERYLEVDHLRRRFFHLPDSSLDTGTLRIYRSVSSGGEMEVAGRRYAELSIGSEYDVLPGRGWIHLTRPVRSDEVLLAYYESGGFPVGSAALGADAFIDASGSRVDFAFATHPDYLASGDRDYLVLYQQAIESYWELRNAYPLPGDYPGPTSANEITVAFALTGTGAPNTSYAFATESFVLWPETGALLFTLQDTAGFHPRPFPGPEPFVSPSSPFNPYDPDNRIYGERFGEPDDSETTIVVTSRVESASYAIPDLFVPGSVRVTVDGVALDPSRFEADELTGEVTIAAGIAGPRSLVEITYTRAAELDAAPSLSGGVETTFEGDRFTARNLLLAQADLGPVAAPRLGEERVARIANSFATSASWALGERIDLSTRIRGAAEFGTANAAGIARVADMSPGATRALPLAAREWQLASPSQLLPVSAPVSLVVRGPLVFENLVEKLAFSEVLRTVDWDNSANRQFAYSEKAGPYNSADSSGDGEAISLVLDYRFSGGVPDQYVAVAAGVSGELDRFGALEIVLRGDGVTGEPVRLFLEVLDTIQEDLDGDDEIDREAAPDSEGVHIVPAGGTVTVVGTDETGAADGEIWSEDLTSNGILDPPGPYGSDIETGFVLEGDSGTHIAELAVGNDEWQTVTVDLAGLDAAERDVLSRAAAVRLTVVPVSVPSGDRSGRVLVNRIGFLDAGLRSSDPAVLETRPITDSTSPELASNRLAEAFPTLYERLQGDDDYREREAIPEHALSATVNAPVVAGERVSLRSTFPVGSLRDYRRVGIFLYRPETAVIPADARFDLRLLRSRTDYAEVTVTPTDLVTGWNALVVPLDRSGPATVNDHEIGEVAGADPPGGARVYAIELGVSAGAGGIASPFTFWTDEWWADGSAWRPSIAGGVEVELAGEGDLIVAAVPIVSDLHLRGWYDYAGGVFVASDDESRPAADDRTNSLGGASSVVLLGSVPVTAAGSWELRENPASPAATTAARISATVGFAPGDDRLPVVEHGFQASRLTRTALGYSLTEEVVVDELEADDAGWVQVQYPFAARWSLGYQYDLVRDVRRTTTTDRSSGTQTIASLGVSTTTSHEVSLAGAALEDRGAVTVTAEHAVSRSGGAIPDGELVAGYGELWRIAFHPTESGEVERADSGLLVTGASAESRRVGVSAEIRTRLVQDGFDSDAGPRDASSRTSVSLAIPVRSPGGSLTIEPSIAQSIHTSAGRTADLASALRFHADSSLFAVVPAPAYLVPRAPDGNSAGGRVYEVEVLDGLRDAGATRAELVTAAGARVELTDAPWYLPSRLRVAATGTGAVTEIDHSQTRGLEASLGSTRVVADPSGAVSAWGLDGNATVRRDYRADTDRTTASLSGYLSVSTAAGASWQLSPFAGWTRLRQRPGDPAMLLFVIEPERERPPTPVADTDTLTARLSATWIWGAERVPRGSSPLTRRLGIDPAPQAVTNTEQLSAESSYTWTRDAAARPASMLPFRITAEHTSEVRQSDWLSIRVHGRAQGGVEQRAVGGAVTVLPDVGLEARIDAVLSY